MRILPALVLLLPSWTALAQQHWPLQFDPQLAADPADAQQQLAQGDAQLPLFPVDRTTPVDVGPVRIWVWPEIAAQQNRALLAGPGDMAWPDDAEHCAAHVSLDAAALSTSTAGSCAGPVGQVTAALSNQACLHVDQPEHFVESAPPAEVNMTSTASVEALIGLAGEALRHPPLPDHLLPEDFVPVMRSVVRKLRSEKLVAELNAARTAYQQALSTVDGASGCFNVELAHDRINALIAELEGARDFITTQNAAGQAEHDREELRLGAHARARKMLGFPSLTRAERRFTAFWLGGIYWRMRGGGLIPLGSTQQARYYFLQRAFTQLAELSGASDGGDAVDRIFLAIFEGWGEWMDMGRTPGGGDKYYDLVRMTRRGERQVKSAADLLSMRGYDGNTLLAGGLQMGPCYVHAWDVLAGFRYADMLTDPYGPFIEFPTAVGEFCTGAAIALGLADTLLDGYATGMPPTCAIDCTGRACGDDGCGGECGACEAGLTCNAGQCGGAPASSSSSVSPPESSSSSVMDLPSSAGAASSSPGFSSSSASRASSSESARLVGSSGQSSSTGTSDPEPQGGCACESGSGSGPVSASAFMIAVTFAWRRRSRRLT